MQFDVPWKAYECRGRRPSLTGVWGLILGLALVGGWSPSIVIGEETTQQVGGASAASPLRLSGVVVDAADGAAMSKATVVFRWMLVDTEAHPWRTHERLISEPRRTTDAEGRYSVEAPADQANEKAVRLDVRVEHDDYVRREIWGGTIAQLRSRQAKGDSLFCDRLTLKRGEAVTGTVLKPDGSPAAGVLVRAYSSEPQSETNAGVALHTTTDNEGKFRINFHLGGHGAVWAIPQDAAVTGKTVGTRHGDLGVIRLEPGVRVSGRMFTRDGQPLADQAVVITNVPPAADDVVLPPLDPEAEGTPPSQGFNRSGKTDAEGRFVFAPLPAGDYQVAPVFGNYDFDASERTSRRLPDVFVPERISLVAGVEPKPLELRPVPKATLRVRNFDSAGGTLKDSDFLLHGEINGVEWQMNAWADEDGVTTLEFPRGLTNVSFCPLPRRSSHTPEVEEALRYRMTAGEPLRNWPDTGLNIYLGTLNDDLLDFQVIRYRPTKATVRCVDERNRPITDFQLMVGYESEGRESGLGCVDFESTWAPKDGSRRAWGLLPDEDLWITASLPGYTSASQSFRLQEGEVREFNFVLKRTLENRLYEAALRVLATPRAY